MANRGGTPANLKEPWQKGKSGNPKGRPCVDQKLREMRDEFGEWPREELMRMAKDKRLRPEARMRVLQYLDEQFNGRAKQSMDANLSHEAGDSVARLMEQVNGKTRSK